MNHIDHSQSPDHRPGFWAPNTGTLSERRSQAAKLDRKLDKEASDTYQPLVFLLTLVLVLLGVWLLFGMPAVRLF
jgi:hypothetical protein